MGESDVSMRLATKELDWAPLGEVRLDRIDSETFSIQLRSNEWIVRPLDVAGFLFGTRERLQTPTERPGRRPRETTRIRSLAWAVLHGFLALSILGIGVVIGRYSLDGSNVLSAMVAILVMGVGLLWSRIVPGSEAPKSTRPTAGIRQPVRPTAGGRLRGDVDVLKEILGDRVQPGPRPAATSPRPVAADNASWLKDVELPTLEQGADDLTIIRGIGPAVASRLASAGIVTYKQIGRLNDTEFHKLARVLGATMHRIDLDAWHRDATMAYEHKYGHPMDSRRDDEPEPSSPEPSSPDPSNPDPSNPELQPGDDSAADREAPAAPTSDLPEHTPPEEASPGDAPPGLDGIIASQTEPEFAWWGSDQSDTQEIESAWREIDDSVLMLDSDDDAEPDWSSRSIDGIPDPGMQDDLTGIKGIGEATARKLANIGVVSLAQIADADAEQISHMEAALGFRSGRFAAERWQEQARDLLNA